ncbi:hypothetical protein [Natronococcus occultus]|uniref:Uncharacterized protein n=1 Tax=Natronococcus occultus SP4 TaxID=694430 RepID=L0JWW5_9EURY|nr:hypothetical protein [Natronococcus occultus]AGB36328.1 hypothetical protein Natoc_0465 [Natronococcus occultus SP4]
MHSETIAFGGPLAGLVVGAAILVGSLFLSGLSVVSVIGGAIGLLAIAVLALAVARSPADATVELEEREDEESRLARGAK